MLCFCFNQQLTASEAFERKTIIVKIKQFEVRTEITEVIQQGKVLSKSEKEVRNLEQLISLT